MIAIAMLVVVTSCSSERRLERKWERLERFAEKTDQTLIDTIQVEIIDTVITEELLRDTITKLVYNDTTIVINDERVSVKYVYDTLTEDIYHEVLVKADTIIKTIRVDVPVDRVVITENKKSLPWWTWFLAIAVIWIWWSGKR